MKTACQWHVMERGSASKNVPICLTCKGSAGAFQTIQSAQHLITGAASEE